LFVSPFIINRPYDSVINTPLSKSGPQTAKVLMSHTKEFNTIMETCGSLLKLEDKGVFKCTVQAEKTTVIGWGYMTTRQTNKDELATAITQTIGVPIGLQWRMITTGQAMDKIPEDQKVRALHFEVEDEDVDYAKRVLGDLYHHSRCFGFLWVYDYVSCRFSHESQT
jgi:hypothetical protein